MKYLITGLGNPGAEYENTRHNIGFKVCDFIAQEQEATFSSSRYGWVAETRIKNKTLFLLKPETFMNLSGKAVRYWLDELKISRLNLLIITDDLALPCGKLRMKTKGSDGGHNGLKSINEIMNTQDYARLRFGISADFAQGRQVDYVLGEWNAEEKIILKEKIPLAAEATRSFVMEGVDKAMAKYNNN
ncbi:MAG: aminoacyl-tRNA hydrolase [Bacteroidetes bacterium]|nr:aminoacyl-tRNA hydrolase [Bacteroidota bacterium]